MLLFGDFDGEIYKSTYYLEVSNRQVTLAVSTGHALTDDAYFGEYCVGGCRFINCR